MRPATYTTRDAAKKVGITRQTLQAWIASGKVLAPEPIAGLRIRLWTKADIVRLRCVKERIYRKNMGRPKG